LRCSVRLVAALSTAAGLPLPPVRRRRPVRLGLEGLESRELLNASLVGDLTQLRNDLATATLTLVNAATPSPTNTPTLASVENQFVSCFP
jgi:hypothetical protein